jgi:DNA replication ATP-dependent helicase Dna2
LSSDADGAEFARRLVAIVRRERRAAAGQLRELHDLAVEERVAQGEALHGLAVVGRRGERIVLRCAENASRLREGDPLWLSTGDPRARGAVAVAFRSFDPRAMEVEIELDRGVRFEPGEGDGYVLDRRDLDLADRELAAIQAVFAGREEFAAARGLLLGAWPAAIVSAVTPADTALATALDADQKQAFEAALTRRFALVQGPPGAGKTTLAVAILRAALARGARIVVTAFTHRAVDNVLSRLARELDAAGEPGNVIKIERSARAALASVPRVRFVESSRRLGEIDRGTVVGATTSAAAGLVGRAFDLVLVDEAGQVSLSHGCAALALASRHVLVGDHAQLPPLVVGRHSDPLARRSLFEHLHDLHGSLMLRTTWRMNEGLCAFPSESFYARALAPAPQVANRAFAPPTALPPPLDGEGGNPLAVISFEHRGARVLSPSEAHVATLLVVAALRAGVPASEIAVIAPHRAQGNEIRRRLQLALPEIDPSALPVVDTVERLQGGERDLVIVSLTASDPEAMHRDSEFFFSPNRLNVALTRARRKLIVLMSDALLEAWPDEPRALAGAERLRRLYRGSPRLAAGDVISRFESGA